MKERAASAFPYAVAAVLPLAGLVLAGLRAFEVRSYDATLLACASLLGALIYLLLLS